MADFGAVTKKLDNEDKEEKAKIRKTESLTVLNIPKIIPKRQTELWVVDVLEQGEAEASHNSRLPELEI